MDPRVDSDKHNAGGGHCTKARGNEVLVAGRGEVAVAVVDQGIGEDAPTCVGIGLDEEAVGRRRNEVCDEVRFGVHHKVGSAGGSLAEEGSTAEHRISAGCGSAGKTSSGQRNAVGRSEARDGVVPVQIGQVDGTVVACGDVKDVRSRATSDGVVTGAVIDDVVAGAAANDIVEGAADQDVIEGPPAMVTAEVPAPAVTIRPVTFVPSPVTPLPSKLVAPVVVKAKKVWAPATAPVAV